MDKEIKENKGTKDRGAFLRDLLRIYLLFFKIGATTFGGGYAMLPILRREIVQKYGWCTEDEVMDYYAVSQGMPGIIAVNVSIFIGHSHLGALGGIVAALGMVSPCLIIITIIAAFLSNFQNNPYVRHALGGISVCVGALIFDAVIGLWKKGVKDVFGLCLCLAALLVVLFTDISAIIVILCAAVIGLVAQMVRRKMNGGKKPQ